MSSREPSLPARGRVHVELRAADPRTPADRELTAALLRTLARLGAESGLEVVIAHADETDEGGLAAVRLNFDGDSSARPGAAWTSGQGS